MRKIPNLRWYIVALLTLMTTINYLDRTALSVAQTVLEEEFNMSARDFGEIVAFFLIAYGLMHPLMGRLIDWLGTRRGLTLAFVWWSVASIIHCFTSGVATLKLFRAILGVGEAANFPGAVKTVGEWFPPRERALATGIFNLGAGMGAAVAQPMVGVIIYYYGWRAAFVITGAIGFLWLIPWLGLAYRPEEHPRITPEELDYIKRGQAGGDARDAVEVEGKGSWREALARRDLWALMASRLLADPAWLFFSFWIPKFFKDVHGFDVKEIALFAWVPFVASDIGSVFGGWLSSWLVRRTGSVVKARKLGLAFAAALMPAAIGAVHTQSWQLALLCISIAAFAHQCWSASMLTFPSDLFPRRIVASAYGLTGMAGVMGGVVSQWYVGGIIDRFGYLPVFTIVGCLHPVGALVTGLIVRGQPAPRVADRAT